MMEGEIRRMDANVETPMQILKQTGTTIIFEEFNDTNNLVNALRGAKSEHDFIINLFDQGSDVSNYGLVVKSFDEFVEKFMPDIYETYDPDSTGAVTKHFVPKFVYSAKPLNKNSVPIKIKDHPFYKSILRILKDKKDTYKSNLQFPLHECLDTLTPNKTLKDLLNVINECNYLLEKWSNAQQSGISSAELDETGERIEEIKEELATKWISKSIPALFPLQIARCDAKIKNLKKYDSQNGLDGDDQKLAYELVYSDHMLPMLRPVKAIDGQSDEEQKSLGEGGEANRTLPGKIEETVQTVIENGEEMIMYKDKSISAITASELRALVPQEKQQSMTTVEIHRKFSSAMKEIISLNARPEVASDVKIVNFLHQLVIPEEWCLAEDSDGNNDVEEIQALKSLLMDIHIKNLESFTAAVSAVMEKIIGVKTFFDHATVDGKLPPQTSVIIANCKASDIVGDPEMQDNFEKYFRHLSKEKDVFRIWYGIVPAISYDGYVKNDANKHQGKIDIFGAKKYGEKKEERGNSDETDLISLKNAQDMLKLLEKVKIMTFTNFKAFEKTDFKSLNTDQLQEFKDKFEGYNNEYAVLTYPNFTVIPKKTQVLIGRDIINGEDKPRYAQLPGIYIESSYVAAGLMVGIQNMKKLEQCGLRVRRDHPSVRFDISDGKRVQTELNREMETNMKDMEQEIRARPFGFAFMGNSGHGSKNTYVISACSLSNKDDVYKNIYQTLVKSAIDIIIEHHFNGENTKEKGDEFKELYVKPWMQDVPTESAEYANSILLCGESIEVSVEDKDLLFSIKFKKAREVLRLKISDDDRGNSNQQNERG